MAPGIMGNRVSSLLARFCLSIVISLPLNICAQSNERPKHKDFGSSLKRTKWDPVKQQAVVTKPNAKANDDSDLDVVKVETSLVSSDVLVRDARGNTVDGLTEKDFLINEDGAPQKLGMFSLGTNSNVARTIVLIIDYSGSQLPFIETSIAAAKTMIDKLGPLDRIAIVDDDVEMIQDFTTDKKILKEGKRRLYMPMRQEYLTGKPMGFSPLTYPRGEQSEGPISMILVNVSSSADIWTVKVSVVRDVRLYEKRQSPLATYTGRLNVVFKVDEAKSVGIEPFELQIVAVEPEAARVPQITNKTSSIAVMHLSGTIAPEPYSLLMQNQSGKRVIGLEVNAYNGNQRSVLIWRKGLWNGILIEPGSTYELKVKSATGGATTNDKAPSQPDKIEIATVVFLDGSYEGDPLYAALINNEITECDVQVTRALAALRSAAGQSSDQVIPFLTKASSSLTEKFEVSEIN